METFQRLIHPFEGIKGLKSKRMLINYFYDWEVTINGNMAEFTDGLVDLFKSWEGTIFVHEISDLYFHLEKQGPNSVTEYFDSRNLEPPPNYNHKFFLKYGQYHILQIRLEVSIKTRDGLFVDYFSRTKDQDEFKTWIIKCLRECWKCDGKEVCCGFNIDVMFVEDKKRTFFNTTETWPEEYKNALDIILNFCEPIFKEEFLANVIISDELLALITDDDDEHVTYSKFTEAYFFSHLHGRLATIYIFATENDIKHINTLEL